MRLHGLVYLTLLAIGQISYAQDGPLPRPLDPAERQAVPDLNDLPPPADPVAPGRPAPPSTDRTNLESEIEALRSDLQAFHALSDDVAKAARSAEAEADRSMLRQRQEMLDLLTKLATQGIARKVEKPAAVPAAPPTPAPAPDSIAIPAVTDAAVDQFALGKVLFRAGDFVKAEQAFRKVAQTDDNRLMMQYLIATCLRKRSQWNAALEMYREIAESKQDPVLRDLAKFQLDGIRWNQETEQQIDQLRQQRQKKPATRTDQK